MPARTAAECDALFAQHMAAGDLDALVALYEPGATLVGQDGRPATGHAAIREALAPLAAAKPRFRMNVTRETPAGGDLVALYNDWSGSLTGPDGRPVEMRGRALELCRRQADGTWRFVLDDPFVRA